MNTQPNNSASSANNKSTNNTQPTQEIDLMALLGALLDRKYFIVAVTALFMFVGVVYAVLSTPVYQATAMIQVED
ncbi:Wzz/FepE/Etk N-terminal domain-containing protein, partial [Pseudoalteromonas sp. TAE56]|uniref:Wzz/FepE/Etk N-terminal domain-containing protein n=1 Tax=Pseudoalteromonas sp. TAE56 TaxID=1938596 RepID=UPI0011117891